MNQTQCYGVDWKGKRAPQDPSHSSLNGSQHKQQGLAKCTYRCNTCNSFDRESMVLSTSHSTLTGTRILEQKCFIFAFLLKFIITNQ